MVFKILFCLIYWILILEGNFYFGDLSKCVMKKKLKRQKAKKKSEIIKIKRGRKEKRR